MNLAQDGKDQLDRTCSNEEVLSLVQEQGSLVKQRQANWIRYVLRHDCLLKTVLERKMENEEGRCWKQEYKKISYEELKREAQSRVGWRRRHWNLPQGRARKKKKKALVRYINLRFTYLLTNIMFPHYRLTAELAVYE